MELSPRAEGTSRGDLPPMAKVRDNMRIRWYRCPVDRETLRALAEPSDARGLLQASGHLALWATTGGLAWYFFTLEIWWAFGLFLFLHGTVAAFFTSPHHELCHTTVFRTKWLNESFLRVFSVLGWLNFEIYRFSHTHHHRFTLFSGGDREKVMPEYPSLRPLYLLQAFTVNVTGGYHTRGLIPVLRSFVRIALNRVDAPFNHWGPELYDGYPDERMKAVRWARLVLLLHAVSIFVFVGIGQPILAVLVSGSIFYAGWLRYFVGVTQHCGLRSNVDDFRKCARTITLDPVTQFLFWHMNWHVEHHMYGAVPCYNLAKLHRIVAHDMPAPRTLIGAWKEMRETWKRQQKEPGYAYDTPVPELQAAGERRDDDPIVASMGGLVPRALA